MLAGRRLTLGAALAEYLAEGLQYSDPSKYQKLQGWKVHFDELEERNHSSSGALREALRVVDGPRLHRLEQRLSDAKKRRLRTRD